MRDLEADLGIPKTTVSKVLTQDLGTKHVVAKFVLQLPLPEQKGHGAAVANDLIQTAINEPDLAPCGFCLFLKIKPPLKGKRFQTISEIQENTTGQLMAIGELCEVPGASFEGD